MLRQITALAVAGSCLGSVACTAILGNDFAINAGGAGGSTGGGGTAGGGGVAHGTHQWSKRFGDAENQQVHGLVVDANGQAVVVGEFSGTIDFGTSSITAQNVDAFVVKLDTEGQALWAHGFGATGATVVAYAVAVTSTGDVAVTGSFQGDVNFGDISRQAQDEDVFVLKLTSSGAFAWVQNYPAQQPQSGRALAIGNDDNIVVAGNYIDSINFGAGALTSPAAQAMFVAVLNPYGTAIGSHGFGDASQQAATGVAADSVGNAYLTGHFDYLLDFGNNTGVLNAVGGTDLFVAKLNSSGTALWSRGYGTDGNDEAAQITLSPTHDTVALAGAIAGPMDFGGGAVPYGGALDAFVALFGPDGAHRHSLAGGDSSDQRATTVALGVDGTTWMAGVFGSAMDLGPSPLHATSSADLFLVARDAAWQPLFARAFPAGGMAQGDPSLAACPDSGVILATTVKGTVDLGGGPLVGTGSSDLLIAKFY